MSAPSLEEKYQELLRLREERETLEARGVFELDGEAGRARKARCRELARRYPGALRELEALDARALHHRLRRARTVPASREGGGAFEEFLDLYHALGRIMRHLKRWQGAFRGREGRHPTVGEARAELDRAGIGSTLAPTELEQWLHPPGGRVQDALWRKLGRHFDRRPEVLKHALLNSGGEASFGSGDGGAKEVP